MRIIGRLGKQKSTLKILFKNNAESIMSYNSNILSTLIFVAIIVMFIPILLSPFSERKMRLVPLYLLSIALFFLAFFVFRLKPFKKRPVLGIYLVFFGAFLFSIYLSVLNSPDQRATIILGLFCVFPMCIIDRPYRIQLFSVGFYIVHIALAFIFKTSALAIDDAVNCFCFLTLGNTIGVRLIKTRAEAFESRRQLVLEKETDELTGLGNRRKLFQLLGELETGDSHAPSGVIMMDIDDFKGYNDQFGHAAGDRLLNHLGKLLLHYEEMFDIQFFRYGGEEFAGLAWGYHASELQSILEALKESINGITGCHQEVKVSIGMADCKAEKFKNFEKYIELADKALYRAKAKGKNKVVCFDMTIDSAFPAMKKSFASHPPK
ncbi:MAG: GGDEF domain-containing protein [Christensenellales bacterium]|jgi:diguanylate cyclase (GGDEF)-like protein